MFGRYRFIPILIAATLIFSFASTLLYYYTDWLFFIETGYTSVFTTRLTAGIGAGLLFGIPTALFALVNLLVVNRFPIPSMGVFIPGAGLRIGREEAVRLARPLAIVASVALALLAGKWGAAGWEDVLLFTNRVNVGTLDPVNGKDIGFYLFSLPFLEMLTACAGLTLPVVMVMVGLLYWLRGAITLSERGIAVDMRVRRHLAVLVAIFSLTIAAGFYLDGFRLLLSGSGAFNGAGYADVHARLPTYRILAFLTPFAGVMFAAGIWKGAWRTALLPAALLCAVYGGGIVLYPSMLQKFKVAPNELDLEKPYIENNIRFTRMGYDLDKIETIPFDVDLKLTAGDIANNDATIRNIRLWDHAPLLKTYSQLQQIRTYYKFFDVDNDRYLVNGRYTQVMLSPRELSYADLPSRNWINEHLIFTHGNGLTMGPVSRISKEGLPEFFVKDIPPVSLADIRVKRPEIYFGELSNEYVIVKSRLPDFDTHGPSIGPSVAEILASHAGGTGSPTKTAARVADAIEARGDDGAWLSTVPREELLAVAAAIELRPGARTLPLYGVPFGVKDSIDVAGVPTTLSCPDYAYVAERTAPAVQRLLDAGALYVGKTNLDQFATGLNGTRTPYTVPRSVFGGEMIWRFQLGLGPRGRPGPGPVRGRHRHRRIRTGTRGTQRRGGFQAVARAHQHRRPGAGVQIPGLPECDGRLYRRCRPRLRGDGRTRRRGPVVTRPRTASRRRADPRRSASGQRSGVLR